MSNPNIYNLNSLSSLVPEIISAPTGAAVRQAVEKIIPHTGAFYPEIAVQKRDEFNTILGQTTDPLSPARLLEVKAKVIEIAATGSIASSPTLSALEEMKGRYVGSNGAFTIVRKELGTLPKGDRPATGKSINEYQQHIEKVLARRRDELEVSGLLPKEPIDFTAPGRRRGLGRLHPLTQVTDDIVRAFRKLGFAVADGPEVEDEYHVFDALNTPADHPARDSQDTFYLQAAERPLLRTHTSSVQIRVMKSQPPPVRIVVPGRVFRRDNADATHNPTFHQIEGLYVDRHVTVGDLKGTVEFVFRELMGKDTKIRFRPHYFSYTEPSLEIDFTNSLVKKLGKDWLEIAGCGMVHPQVFENVGYDPEVWTGWAFGFGVERIAMLRHGINDIRLFYENDVRFLKQF